MEVLLITNNQYASMGNRRKILLIILFILILAHFLCAVKGIGYSNKFNQIDNFTRLYNIKSIRILDSTFEVVANIDNQIKCIECRNIYKIKSNSKNKIINFLNSVEKPRLLIFSKITELYVSDFIFIQNGNDIKFSEWLKSNRLAYDK